MGLAEQIKVGDWRSVRSAIAKLNTKLGPVSEPTFAGLALTGFTASRLVATNANKKLVSSNLIDWVTGTTNRVTVSADDDPAGGIILTGPQDIHTGASPTFNGLIVNGTIDIDDDTLAVNSVAHQTLVNENGIGLLAAGDVYSLYLKASPGSLNENKVLEFNAESGAIITVTAATITLGNWFDQSVKIGASPTFAGLALTGMLTIDNAAALILLHDSGTNVGHYIMSSDTTESSGYGEFSIWRCTGTAGSCTLGDNPPILWADSSLNTYITKNLQVGSAGPTAGNITAYGTVTAAGATLSGELDMDGNDIRDANLFVTLALYHHDDLDTGIMFGTNKFYFFVGDAERIRFQLGSALDRRGVIINENGDNADFSVEGDTDPNLLYTDASTDRVGIGEAAPQDKLEVNGTILVKDKLKFTQDDGNEYIDSLADGYMDYGATTAHRFNNGVEVTGKLSITHTDNLLAGFISSSANGTRIDIENNYNTELETYQLILGSSLAGGLDRGEFGIYHGAYRFIIDNAGDITIGGALNVTGIVTLGDGSLLATSAAPTTDAMIANKKYVDDQIATIGFVDRGDPDVADWHETGAKDILNTDGNWHDLDCSSIVSVGAIAILFRLLIRDDAAGSSFSLRKNGNSNIIVQQGVRTQVANVYMDGCLVVACDANQVVEYNGSNLAFVDVQLTIAGWWLG